MVLDVSHFYENHDNAKIVKTFYIVANNT